jgi:hypothetical protein
MTEQSLALNLAVFGSGVTPAIKHGGNHFAFIAISRKTCFTSTPSRYTVIRSRLGSMFTRIVVENCQAHMASIKKPRYCEARCFSRLPDIGLIPLHWPSADSRLTPKYRFILPQYGPGCEMIKHI